MTYYLELPDALLQIRYLGFHVRDMGLLNGSLSRPQTTVYGEEAYPSLSLKAAALIHSVITSRPMMDGNKRTGWTLMITFLQLNNWEVVSAPDDAFEFVLSVATNSRDLEDIARWIDDHLVEAHLG